MVLPDDFRGIVCIIDECDSLPRLVEWTADAAGIVRIGGPNPVFEWHVLHVSFASGQLVPVVTDGPYRTDDDDAVMVSHGFVAHLSSRTVYCMYVGTAAERRRAGQYVMHSVLEKHSVIGLPDSFVPPPTGWPEALIATPADGSP